MRTKLIGVVIPVTAGDPVEAYVENDFHFH